ncbi:MAG: EAL domain-containing protein [Methylophilus sp.]
MKRLAFFQRFLLPLFLVGILAIFSTAIYMFTLNMNAIKNQAETETNELSHLLAMAKSLVGERVYSSIELLKLNGAALGKPYIDGTIKLNDEIIPKLMLGYTSITQKTELVDDVTNIGNGTATIFVKNKNEFIRITTNVRQKNNARAVGTRLDPNGKAIAKLKMGMPFYGVVDILGEPYISGYEPIFDSYHNIIGAWYVGYKVDVKALDQAIKKWAYLKTGFAAITDYNNNIRFVSEHTSKEKASNVIYHEHDQWVIIKKNIPDWDFHAYMAYPKKEAYLSSINNLYPILLLGSIFGIALLLLALGAIKRFVLMPLGGDPEAASELVSRIAQGNFNEDGTYARPDTLMDNMLKMRIRLREMVTEIKENSDRLSVSSSVFEHAHDGIFITDSKANIIEVNPAFSIITGYSREESLNKNPESLGFAYETEAFFSQFFESTEHQGEWRGEVLSLNKHGESYLIWLDIFPVHSETGEFQHYVGLFSDITKAKEQQKLLEHLAYHDSLTELPNRIKFTNHLQQTLAKSERYNEVIAICYIDLDDFKPINDKYGHEVGDQLLVLLSKRLQNSIGKKDTIARLGGDEFALLLKGRNNPNDYKKVLDRILTVIEQPFIVANHTFSISASIGYTIYPSDNNPPDTLLRHADHAMYHAKTHGGKHYHLFDLHLAQLSRSQFQIEEDIAVAIKNNELRLYFQPQIDTKNGKVVGMEALIRWQHPTQGLLLPLDFLPSIEHTPLIAELGDWVIQEAISHINQWNQEGMNFYVAVNIAAFHLTEKDFTKKLTAVLKKFPTVSGSQISLEITESAAINDINNVTEIIKQCKKLGVTFAIDDFGSGYSSLIYLRRLPVDTIKIDRSFIHGMLQDSENLAVVTSIVTLCREFKREVIAEGVETQSEAQKLAEIGCYHLQGFGISRPMPADKVMAWVNANTPYQFQNDGNNVTYVK